MANRQPEKIYLYTRYERLWHWLQMIMILVLTVTGFEIHGTLRFIGFETAVRVHNFTGITWLISFAFFVFWVITTGEWRQYIPTTQKMLRVIRYYLFDIFRHRPHPFNKQKDAKLNPLQRLVYLALATLLLPVQMATGLLYYTYNGWDTLALLDSMPLESIAWIHMLGGGAVLQFILVHVYMATTGHTVWAHIKAMITGWEEMPLSTNGEK